MPNRDHAETGRTEPPTASAFDAAYIGPSAHARLTDRQIRSESATGLTFDPDRLIRRRGWRVI
jgi:hypothetical protein